MVLQLTPRDNDRSLGLPHSAPISPTHTSPFLLFSLLTGGILTYLRGSSFAKTQANPPLVGGGVTSKDGQAMVFSPFPLSITLGGESSEMF